VVALNNLAWNLSEAKKRPDEALPLAVKAEQLAPRMAEVLDTLGWIQYRRGDYAEARKTLTRAVERAPNHATIQYHLGMVYSRLGQKDQAVSALRLAAQADPQLAQREKIPQLITELGG
jgi:tetratricopeptide (TPR) repeat protein